MNLDTCTPGQKTIITTLDKPLMVSAGAGSGKTFTLTQRIAFAFDSEYLDSIDQIMAITFTKKAAAELKTRIKKQLLTMGLHDEALRVDDAWISTIHGMCSRILKEHALELGIDPSFEMLGDVDQQVLLTSALNSVLRQLEEEPELSDVKAFVQNQAGNGINSSLVSYALELRNKVHSLPDEYDSFILDAPQVSANDLICSLVELGYEFLDTANSWDKPGKQDTKMLDAIQSAVEGALSYLGDNTSDFSDSDFDSKLYLQTVLAFPKPPKNFHAKKEDGPFFESYSYEFAKIVSEVQASISCGQLEKLVTFTRMLDEAYQKMKGVDRLDNNDLLIQAYHALRDNPSIAQAYREQFKLIMVDEFQDTDTLQVALLSLLSKDHFGNVTTVGDAQQSIYRFRGADVEVFFGYEDTLIKENPNATLVSLPDNFRSHRDVLSFVDAVFGQETVFGERFLSLKPRGAVNNEHDSFFDQHPRISMNVYETRRGQSTLSQAREKAANCIADYFVELRKSGVPASDMVVLLGSLSNVSYYLNALRSAGFETTITGGSVFSSSNEASLVNSLLSLAANPFDSSACFEILSSPLCNVSDVDLYALKRFNKKNPSRIVFSQDVIEQLSDERGADFSQSLGTTISVLATYLELVEKKSLVYALYWVIEASGYWLRLQENGAEGMANAGNLVKAISFVQAYCDEGLGVVEAAREYSQNLETLKEAPGVLNTGESDFVRIMTIHASKGLEFPHVGISEMRLGSSRSTSFIVDNIDGRTVAYLSPESVTSKTNASSLLTLLSDESDGSAQEVVSAKTPGQRRGALVSYEYRQECQEARRLLYVALTRASKSLCLSFAVEGNKDFDYSSKGILNDLYTALKWETGSPFVQQMIDYGGTTPLRFRLEVLQKEDEEDALSSATEEVDQERNVFVVPSSMPEVLSCVPFYRSKSRSLVSYSSLSQGVSDLSSSISGKAQNSNHHDEPLSSDISQDDEEWLDMYSGAFVDSRELRFSDDFDGEGEEAVSLGSAFHRLAQRGIINADINRLSAPDISDIRVQAAHYGLQSNQVHRLINAVSRWFNSDLAKEFARFGSLEAEVPFLIPIKRDGVSFVLEGEIDGLARNDNHAFFIDYKTGGFPDESPDELYEKHHLQAQCYAYALLCSGFKSVEARFVRVEQQDLRREGDEPQVIPYSFSQDDFDLLEQTIVSAWQQLQKTEE